MTRDNVKNRLALAVNAAAKTIPNLAKRHVPPHTIRHTTAMHSLQSGADICVNRAAAFWRAKRLNERTLPIIQWNVQCRASLAWRSRAKKLKQSWATVPRTVG